MFDKTLTTDERIDAFAELMVTKLDEIRTELKGDIHKVEEKLDNVENHLEKVEFNTSGLEKRTSILEDKVRIISTKIGLN
jgi:hypothetical protein